MALNGLFSADVPLRNYSLTHSICPTTHFWYEDFKTYINDDDDDDDKVCHLVRQMSLSGQPVLSVFMWDDRPIFAYIIV